MRAQKAGSLVEALWKFFLPQFPEGFFVNDLIVYGFLERGCLVAKGFELEVPYVRFSSESTKFKLQFELEKLLRGLADVELLEFRWRCGNDFKRDLLGYQKETQNCAEKCIREYRDKRFVYFAEKLENRLLRRETLTLFIGIRSDKYSGNLRSKKSLRAFYSDLLQSLEARFSQIEERIRMGLGQESCVRGMTDLDHFAYFKRFLNPSIERNAHIFNFEKHFRAEESILSNCMSEEGVSIGNALFFDDAFHSFFVLNRWPDAVCFGVTDLMTKIGLIDYELITKIFPLKREKVIDQEKTLLSDERKILSREPENIDLKVSMISREDKITQLANGAIYPFDVEYILHVWSSEEEDLKRKEDVLKQAVRSMEGADVYGNALPMTTRRFFIESFPAYTQKKYPFWRKYAQDNYISSLIPFSSTFTGRMDGAQALYDGENNNVVGVKLFEGNTPQHSCILGVTGAGKSFFVQDLLFQTENIFDYTVIIEEGNSYDKYTKALNCKTLTLSPNSPFVINYFDTRGLPLNSELISTAGALLSRMIGQTSDLEKQYLRTALLCEYVRAVFEDAFVNWELKYPEKSQVAKRWSYACWLKTKETEKSFLETFSELKQSILSKNLETLDFVNGLDVEAIENFAREPETRRFYEDTCFAFFRPEEYPKHRDLVNCMERSPFEGHDEREVRYLATRLKAWTSGGSYGVLFDGTTNVDLTSRVVHFELGRISENLPELKMACGLLITGFVRQHILSLPRAQKKRIIFEELSRFLDVEGGEKIVAEAYAQLRKFNCVALSIVQQYDQFKRSNLRSVIMNNSRQFFILRQQDKSDLEDMAKDIGLSESMQERIQEYPLVETQKAQKYSSICYFNRSTQPEIVGTLRYVEI